MTSVQGYFWCLKAMMSYNPVLIGPIEEYMFHFLSTVTL